MIKYLESTNGCFERKLAIAPESKPDINWFTVFIAENGGRKSFLLRCLTEAALGRKRYSPERGNSINFSLSGDLPRQVIAISGTPLDRFPRTGTRDLKASLHRSKSEFVYLGPRASNGMAGVAQSIRSLIGSLLSHRHILPMRADLLERVFSSVGLLPEIDVYLDFAASEKDLASFDKERINEISKFSQRRGGVEGKELVDALSKFRADPEKTLLATKARLAQARPAFQIGTKLPVMRGLFKLGMWELLLRLGHVNVRSTTFRLKSNGQLLHGDRLSSGQWSWLGGFGALIAEIRDGSLLLVDEPENSLHPQWQQDFIGELHAIVSKFVDCQVIVATHSPLIASGVSPEWGSIRTLTRPSRAGAFVKSVKLPTAYGWSASDVYDGVFGLKSSRAPEFLASADLALKMLSMGNEIPEQQRLTWIAQFKEASDALPALDSMRSVLNNVVRRLKGGASETHAGRSRTCK